MTLILQGTDNSVSSPAVQGGTAGTTTGVYYPTTSQVAIATAGVQAMLANANQGVQIANTLGVGATTPSTSGAGITFPATQSASTNANTLDDYEEGTWTPTFGYNVTNPTVSGYVQAGWYVKVGRLVTVYCDVEASSINGGSGNGIIEGLPFTVSASPARNYPIPTFRDCTAVGSGGANTIVCGFTQPNTTYVYIQYQGTNGSYGAAGTVGWNSSGRVTFAVTYLAAN